MDPQSQLWQSRQAKWRLSLIAGDIFDACLSIRRPTYQSKLLVRALLLDRSTEIPAHSAIIDYDSKVRKFLADLPEALRHQQGGKPPTQDGPDAMLDAIFCQYIITIHVNEVLL